MKEQQDATRGAGLIRTVCGEDVEAVARLLGQLGYEQETRRLAAALAEDEPERRVLVAVERDRVVGVLVLHLLRPLHLASGWGLISALVVDEQARGLGIGAALLAAAEALARSAGCGQMELSSSLHREQAHHFYLGQGYLDKPRRFVKSLVVTAT
ncbi:GNAT family N-acetyltransferase [Aeromonas bivalvium]|uniref:GNAT family N-acetyltransferase n=1 Tax=Aeromonas bivalvium TaxID=440079 RepID=UPI0009FD10D3|nr:GNAT family N-acetyltransferase [Aeromonas bivalvium]